MRLDPKIWGPQYWFFLHTIAYIYPNKPTKAIKKKYYDFIQNIPIFIPNEKIGNEFIKMLDNYPVTPYLDSKESLMKWVHYIHNKINILLDKETIDFVESIEMYHKLYDDDETKSDSINRWKTKIIILLILIIFILLIYMFY